MGLLDISWFKSFIILEFWLFIDVIFLSVARMSLLCLVVNWFISFLRLSLSFFWVEVKEIILLSTELISEPKFLRLFSLSDDIYEEEFEDLGLDITLNPFPSPIKETYRNIAHND